MGKESIRGQLSEEVVVGVLKQIVRSWAGTHSGIFRDMKLRFEKEDVKDEIKKIKKQMVKFYNNNCNNPETPAISEIIIQLTIRACEITIVDMEPPDKRPTISLEEICSDVVTRRAKNRAGAIIDGGGHIRIASGVIIDD